MSMTPNKKETRCLQSPIKEPILKGLATMTVLLTLPSAIFAAEDEESIRYPWKVGVGVGALQFEGDEPFNDSYVISGHAGYEYSDNLTLEGTLHIAPELNENFRFDIPTGQRVSRLQEEAGVSSTESVGLALDLLFISGFSRFDPYVSVGAGVSWYSDEVDNDNDISLRVGVGIIANLDDVWSLRLDTRSIVAGSDTEANLIAGGSIFRTLGVQTTKPPPPPPEPVDTDGDGLTDVDETEKHKTDPLNPDTDWDGLSDGEEVKIHKTNPRKRDSDGGGVADGHEVREDKTKPLVKGDDFRLFDLTPVYAADGTTLKKEFLTELDVVGQYLSENKNAKARVEAHVDLEKGMGGTASKKLSQKRAKGIADTLVKQWGLKRSRVKAVGYGTGRPKAKPGSGENERVEIYVK